MEQPNTGVVFRELMYSFPIGYVFNFFLEIIFVTYRYNQIDYCQNNDENKSKKINIEHHKISPTQ